MKDIPKDFVKNCDKVGDCRFLLVKKDGPVYMYHRTNMDGSHRSYEVFVSKFIKKGSPLPGGLFELDDRWAYPGANAFGKTAYGCKEEDPALARFDELVQKVKQKAIDASNVDDDDDSTPAPVVSKLDSKIKELTGDKPEGKKRGRKAANLSSLVYPSSQFTMNDFSEMNAGLSPATLYVHLKSLILIGKAQVVDKITGGRGKPKVVYSMTNENQS